MALKRSTKTFPALFLFRSSLGKRIISGKAERMIDGGWINSADFGSSSKH